jgi:hypothetical protein
MNQNINDMKFITTYRTGVIIFLVIYILASCTTANKAISYMDRHPETASNYCATRFPVRDSIIKGDTVYIPAKNINYRFIVDSLKSGIRPIVIDNTMECADAIADANAQVDLQNKELEQQNKLINQLKQEYRPCVPDTVKIKGDIIYRENTARVNAQQFEIAKLQASKEKQLSQRNWWRKACLITWGIICLITAGWWVNRKLSIINRIKGIV